MQSFGIFTQKSLEMELSRVPGLMGIECCWLLYNIARRCESGGVIVEVGSLWGRSAVALGFGSLHGPKIPVICVDPWGGPFDGGGKIPWLPSYEYRGSAFSVFWRNIQKMGLESVVIPLCLKSLEAVNLIWDVPVMIHIDGCHPDAMLLT